MLKTDQSGRVLKVLTVEDSPVIVARIDEMLADVKGVSFSGNIASIPQAMDYIKVHRPEVIILDIHLRSPDGKTGINLLNILKKLYPDLVIMMLTNLSDDRYRLLCREYGADYYFDKSHDFDKIPDVLTMLIQQRSGTQP